jgi:hypothetical protein
MNLNKSIVKDATLEWIGGLGLTVFLTIYEVFHILNH